jgi:uncharacterized membrane protein YphA (DoxX/SURF4 family)
MRFSKFSGTAVVPFLARVVLALAFATVGFNKLFTTMTVTDAAALQVLRDAGVALTPPAAETDDAADGATDADADAAATEGDSAWRTRPGGRVGLASFSQPEEPAAGDAGDAGDAGAGGADARAGGGDSTGPTAPLPAAAEVRSLHGITMMLKRAASGDAPRVPAFVGDYAKWLAWIAALTEFLGGVMILFGMLTRIWGLGLAIAMVTAFWLTTANTFAGVEASGVLFKTLAFAQMTQGGEYQTAIAQIALFAMALGLVLTGAGPLSVDAILFARDPHKDAVKSIDPLGNPLHAGVPAGAAAMTPGSMAAPMGAAEGTAYPPAQHPGYAQPAYAQPAPGGMPPGVQAPPGGSPPAPPSNAWGTPTAPVPAAEIPLHTPAPPPAPPATPAAGTPSMPLPAADAPASPASPEPDAEPADESPAEEERKRINPGQSFGGEGRPL